MGAGGMPLGSSPIMVPSTRVNFRRDVPGPSGEIFTEEFPADVYLQDSSPETVQLFMKASQQLSTNNQDKEAVNVMMKLCSEGKVVIT